jgi:hypothetical protein
MKQADNFNPGQWLVKNKLTNQSQLNEMPKIGNPNPKSAKQILDYYREQIDIFDPEKINNFNKLANALDDDQDFNNLDIMQQSAIRDKLRGRLMYLIDMLR